MEADRQRSRRRGECRPVRARTPAAHGTRAVRPWPSAIQRETAISDASGTAAGRAVNLKTTERKPQTEFT